MELHGIVHQSESSLAECTIWISRSPVPSCSTPRFNQHSDAGANHDDYPWGEGGAAMGGGGPWGGAIHTESLLVVGDAIHEDTSRRANCGESSASSASNRGVEIDG